MSLKYLLVQNEHNPLKNLAQNIHDLAPTSLICKVGTVQEADQFTAMLPIDVLIIDAEQQGMTEDDVKAVFPEPKFEIIYVVSRPSAIGLKEDDTLYLYKPVKKPEFKALLQRLTERINSRLQPGEAANTETDVVLSRKLSIAHKQGVHFPVLKDIVYLEADNTYTTITLANRQKITTTKPIGKFEEILPANWFFRIHKTYLINLYHFRNCVTNKGYFAVMNSGDALSISRYRVSQFMSLMNGVK